MNLGLWGFEHFVFVEHLFAARLQSLPQRQAKDFRLSSAARGRENIYFAFTGGEILANVKCDRWKDEE